MVLVEDVTDSSNDSPPSTNRASASASASASEPQPSQSSSTSGSGITLIEYIKRDKIACALCCTRLFTIVCTILFVFPFSSFDPSVLYQKALMGNAATSALRLHQRLQGTPFQLSRDYLQLLIVEDSFHYLLFSIIFLNSYPITIVLMPMVLFAVLHVSSYLNSLIATTNTFTFLRGLTQAVVLRDKDIMRFAAMNEILLMPCVVLLIFTGKSGIFVPFVYYRFLSLRYQSRRNRYNRQMFTELRYTVEHYTSRPGCPAMVKNLSDRLIALISRMAPPQAA